MGLARDNLGISKDMSIEYVIKKYPQTLAVFEKHGLGCIGCPAALFESIEQGARAHGMDGESLVEDLNRAAAE